jgi:hypothetical protein
VQRPTQGLSLATVHGDLLSVDGGWPGSYHEQELLALSGLGEVLDAAEVATILDRGFQGITKPREHWHAPVGDRRTKDRLTGEQRAFNRVQAGLRALVEQAIGHHANARAREGYRTAGALVCLARWLHRVPTCPSITDILIEARRGVGP